MSKLIVPWPKEPLRAALASPRRAFPWPNELTDWDDASFLPKACWWRIAMIDCNDYRQVYTVTRHDADDMPICFIWEWFDGYDIILDAGMDRPNVACVCQTCIEPIDYMDLLMEEKPTPRAYRITEYGDRKHPGMYVMPDLDRMNRC